MAITDLIQDPGPDIFYDDGFRNTLEDHIYYFLNHPQTLVIPIDPMDLIIYEFDFFGLLNKYNVDTHLHWITMRLCGLKSPNERFEKLEVIKVPNPTIVSRITQSYQTTNRIT